MGRKRKADCLKSLDLKSEDDGEPSSKDPQEDDPIVRNAANERERSRMRVLSKAFTKLKTTLPWVPPDTKLSKLDTLKLASCYIAHLKQILSDDNSENSPLMIGIATRHHRSSNTVHPMTLTWPFSFNGKTTNGTDNGYGDGTPSRHGHNKHLVTNKIS